MGEVVGDARVLRGGPRTIRERSSGELGRCTLAPRPSLVAADEGREYGLFLVVPGLGLVPHLLRWGRKCEQDDTCFRAAAIGLTSCWRHSARVHAQQGFAEHHRRVHRGKVNVAFALLPECVTTLGEVHRLPEGVWATNALLDLTQAMGVKRDVRQGPRDETIRRVKALQPDLVKLNLGQPRLKQGAWQGEPSSKDLLRAVYCVLLVSHTLTPHSGVW